MERLNVVGECNAERYGAFEFSRRSISWFSSGSGRSGELGQRGCGHVDCWTWSLNFRKSDGRHRDGS
jgi:hypothetical protein